MDKIIKNGSLQVDSINSPIREGERVGTINDIYSIPNPYEGQIIYVIDENKHYVVTELISKTVSGFEFPRSVVSEIRPFQGSGNITQINFGEVENVLDETFNIDLGTASKDLKWKTQYSDEVNVTGLTGKSYNNIEECNTDLYDLWKDKVSEEKPLGCIRRYSDLNNRWHTYQYTEDGWKEIGNYSEIDYSDIQLKPYFISPAGVLNKIDTWVEGEEIYSYGLSDYILVDKVDEIYYNGYITSDALGIITYDENYTYTKNIGTVLGPTTTPSRVIRTIKVSNLDYNTKYIRVCFRTNLNATVSYTDNIFKIYSSNSLQANFSKYRSVLDRYSEIEKMSVVSNIGLWDTNTLNPQAESIVGNLEIINKKSVYLIKVTEEGIVQTIGELQKNNWFRFKDGSYAPVVVSLNPQQPWETTDLGYDIVIGWKDPIWVIGGEIGQSGRKIYGFFNKPTYYDGILSKEVEPTGISAGAITAENDIAPARSIHFDKTVPVGSWGVGGIPVYNRDGILLNRNTDFSTGRRFRYNMNRVTCDSYCKNKNPGKSGLLPTSPAMMFHWMTHVYAATIKYGTKDLSKWGIGLINSNSTTKDNWETQTGFRYKRQGDIDYTYTGNNFKEPYYLYTSTLPTSFIQIPTITHIFSWSSTDRTLGLEHQMVLSHIVENGIQERTKFQYLDFTYWYENIPGVPTLLDGPDMNAKLFKEYKVENYKLLDENSNEVIFDSIEACMEYPIIDGELLVNAPVRQYLTGMESVVTMNEIPAIEGKSIHTNPADLYLCTKQGDLVDIITYGLIPGNSGYGFEDIYDKIDENVIFGSLNGYISECYPYTHYPLIHAGNYNTGECMSSNVYCSSGDPNWGSSVVDEGKKGLVYPSIKQTWMDDVTISSYHSIYTITSSLITGICCYFQVKF